MVRRTLLLSASANSGTALVNIERVRAGAFTHLRFEMDGVRTPAIPLARLERMCERIAHPCTRKGDYWLVHVERVLSPSSAASSRSSTPCASPMLPPDTPDCTDEQLLTTILSKPTDGTASAWCMVQLVRLLMDAHRHRNDPQRVCTLARSWMFSYQDQYSAAVFKLATYWSTALHWLENALVALASAVCQVLAGTPQCDSLAVDLYRRLIEDAPQPHLFLDKSVNGVVRYQVRLGIHTMHMYNSIQPPPPLEKGTFWVAASQALSWQLPRVYADAVHLWLDRTPLYTPLHTRQSLEEESTAHALQRYVLLGARAATIGTASKVQRLRATTPQQQQLSEPVRLMTSLDTRMLPACLREVSTDRLENKDRMHVFGAFYQMGCTVEETQHWAEAAVPGKHYGRDVRPVYAKLSRDATREWGLVCQSSFMPNNRAGRSLLCPFFSEALVDIEDLGEARRRAKTRCAEDLKRQHGVHGVHSSSIRGPMSYVAAVALAHKNTVN